MDNLTKEYNILFISGTCTRSNILKPFVSLFVSLEDIIFNNETYYLNIKDFKKYVETTERKSISLDYLRSEGILIEQELKKTRYRYNIKEFIKKA